LSVVLLALLLGDLLFAQAECGGDVADRVPDCVEWDEDPEHVEEEEVDPEVHEVAAVEIDVADEPLGAEGHEACNDVSSCPGNGTQRLCRGGHTAVNFAGSEDNHPNAGLGILVTDAVANVQCESAVEEDS